MYSIHYCVLISENYFLFDFFSPTRIPNKFAFVVCKKLLFALVFRKKDNEAKFFGLLHCIVQCTMLGSL